MDLEPQRVAIIGAGVAGLAALGAMVRPPMNFDVTVFEKSDKIGGIWNYSESQGPMYRNLRTNLPKPVMSLKDFPFNQNGDTYSYPPHEEVLEYLHSYLRYIKAEHFIKFNTEVKYVAPISSAKDGAKWLLRYKGTDEKTNDEIEATFHSIFVCVGRYSLPCVPKVPGLESFSGTVSHSVSYKVPELFSGKKVVILGAQSSGQDIAIDISSHASEVILSHRGNRLVSQFPSNVIETTAIVEYKDDAFICEEGERILGADALIFCTGYQYSFPFLDKACGITVTDNYCFPLWKQMVNVHHPSMFIFGVTQQVTIMPQSSIQAEFGRAILEGRCKIPSVETMLDEIDQSFKSKVSDKGLSSRYAHCQLEDQWDYNDELAELAGCGKIPRFLPEIFRRSIEFRHLSVLTYRKYLYTTLNDNEFQFTGPEE